MASTVVDEEEPSKGSSANQRALVPSTTRDSHTPYSVFTKSQKRYIVFSASWAGFFSPVSSQIYFPALNSLAHDLNVSSSLINLTLTSYMIFQGLSPMFVGDFADKAGRRPAYLVCFIIYIAANIGLALQDDFAALFVLRCLQSAGSSTTIALSSGVVADIAIAAERGSYMGFVTAGSLLGPALGPIIGGLLSQYLGWRAIFWFLIIFAAAFLVQFILFFPETARAIVGDGSIPPPAWNLSIVSWLRTRKLPPQENALRPKLKFPNPVKTLSIVFQRDTGIILLSNALLFAGFYDVSASIPSIYKELYGLDDLQIGLCYIPFGLGATVASIVSGKLLDRNYRRLAKPLGFSLLETRSRNLKGFPIEKARLQIALPLLTIASFTVIAFGWCLNFAVHLAAPTTILFFMGLTLTGAFNTVGTLLVDLYPTNAAVATASNNFVRCLLGAGATALIDPMLSAMGRGWCFTFIALVMLSTAPLLVLVIKFGPRWREQRLAVHEISVENSNSEKAA
ncbi:putative MFS transporter [Aspergillus ochraceoroseus]|uniref:Citrate exporter 1 n=1 Tax=Aspergillus ochraceoroseus TaxID=138278 RepID=A0A0F8W1S1_9EURO|nr:putative MFS transporter [Aspergillus ochraceoroseus]